MKRTPNEPNDKQHIRQFINCICEGNLAQANKHLDEATSLKLKKRIQNLSKENK